MDAQRRQPAPSTAPAAALDSALVDLACELMALPVEGFRRALTDALERFAAGLGADGGFLLELNPDATALKFRCRFYGDRRASPVELSRELLVQELGWLWRLIQRGEPAYIADAGEAPGPIRADLGRLFGSFGGALVLVPIRAGDRPRGLVGWQAEVPPAEWSPGLAEALVPVAAMLHHATGRQRLIEAEREERAFARSVVAEASAHLEERHRVEQALAYRLQLEDLIRSISSRFIAAAGGGRGRDLDQALAWIGSFFDADHCFFVQAEPGADPEVRSWHRRSEDAGRAERVAAVLAEGDWFRGRLRTGEPVDLRSRDELPAAAAADADELATLGVGAAVVASVVQDGRTIGTLGLAAAGPGDDWPGDAGASVRVLAELCVNARRRRLAERRLAHAALHDDLTGLPNRVLFRDRLERAVRRAKRHQDPHFALLFLDLDGFKQVNDHHGHPVGDRLLQEAAERMRTRIREHDTVARLGGDEFTVLLEEIRSREEALAVAWRLVEDLGQPYRIDGLELLCPASVGVAVNAGAGTSAAGLIAAADEAMYRAKEGREGAVVELVPALASDAANGD